MAKRKIDVQGLEIRLNVDQEGDYICLTDMAKKFNPIPNDLLKSWLRNAVNIDFLRDWELMHNPNFKTVGYDRIRIRTGTNTFMLSVKEWVKETEAIGIYSKSGRYGGTYAHSDIAIQFATWLSPSFYLFVIKEFKRLKEDEARRLNLEWNIRRELAKAHYPMLKEAVLNHMPLQENKAGFYLADEANLINKIVFGMTARQWRAKNPNTGSQNMRDFATTELLLLISGLEIVDSQLIKWDCDKEMRTELLEKFAHDLRRHYRDSGPMQRIKDMEDRQLK